MTRVGFEPTILASERPQTHALGGAATGTGNIKGLDKQINILQLVLLLVPSEF
jgi:hypothetical protein